MPIHFKCPCGRVLLSEDEYAGRKGECPSCGKILIVPQAVGALAPLAVPAGGGAAAASARCSWERA